IDQSSKVMQTESVNWTTRSDGGGGWSAGTDYFVGGTPRAVTTSDLDKNGSEDLIVAVGGPGQKLSVLLAKDGGGYEAPVDYLVASNAQGAVAADLDGDSFPDLIGISYVSPGSVSIFYSSKNGDFSAPATELTTCDQPTAVRV